MVSVNKIDDRTRDVMIDSPSVGEVTVRLLVPAGSEADPNRRWPVLYLLHGANDPDTYRCWTRSTDVATLTTGLPLLVVMPEAGTEGYCSDWFNEGRGGPPAGETFHLVELRQILERDWRASDHRAVAGLSMGGLGAMLYATHLPHLFRAAASFSGVLDTMNIQAGRSHRTYGAIAPGTLTSGTSTTPWTKRRTCEEYPCSCHMALV